MELDVGGITEYEQRMTSKTNKTLNQDISEVNRDEEDERKINFPTEDNVPLFSSPRN